MDTIYEFLILLLVSLLVSLLNDPIVTWVRRWWDKKGDLTSAAILYRLENPKACIRTRRDADGRVIGWEVIATGSSM